MKIKRDVGEIRLKDKKTLSAELQRSYQKLNDLRFSHAFRKIKNTNEIKLARKKIARIWTILGEKIQSE